MSRIHKRSGKEHTPFVMILCDILQQLFNAYRSRWIGKVTYKCLTLLGRKYVDSTKVTLSVLSILLSFKDILVLL